MSGEQTGFLPRDLTSAEREALLGLNAELARLGTLSDGFVFVVGSYHPDRKDRLVDVADSIEHWCNGDIRAKLMDQFLENTDSEVQGHLKFRKIAERADAIVGVVENDQGGFTYEQGIIVDNPEFFTKTFVLKRAYPDPIEHQQYSWMQATSLFDELERAGRLYEWTSNSTFSDTRNEVIRDLTLLFS